MNDGRVSRHKLPAETPGRRKAENMVVLVDGAAHRAEAVVAVRQHVRNGERLKSARESRLNDAHVGDVVRCESVEPQF